MFLLSFFLNVDGVISTQNNNLTFTVLVWFPETECSAECNGILKLSRTDGSGYSEDIACNGCGGEFNVYIL